MIHYLFYLALSFTLVCGCVYLQYGNHCQALSFIVANMPGCACYSMDCQTSMVNVDIPMFAGPPLLAGHDPAVCGGVQRWPQYPGEREPWTPRDPRSHDLRRPHVQTRPWNNDHSVWRTAVRAVVTGSVLRYCGHCWIWSSDWGYVYYRGR